MSVRMALTKLSACAAGRAVVGSGAVHVAEIPVAQGQYRKAKQVKKPKLAKVAKPRPALRIQRVIERLQPVPRQIMSVPQSLPPPPPPSSPSPGQKRTA